LAYFPGTEGGVAVPETLFGENDPSGRLLETIPRYGHVVEDVEYRIDVDENTAVSV
jgi:hypothetical protein